jgi:hypothetical protein
VTHRAEIFLGVIAVATLAIALAQVGVVIVASLAARRVAKLAETVERDLKPIFSHLDTIGRDASRAAALAAAQVERADKLFAEVAGRAEQAMNTLQTTIEAPAREGRALLSAFRAALQALREMRTAARARARAEDDDALFI